MFESFDVDRDGKIDADELGRALAHYECVHPLISTDPLLMEAIPFSFRVGLPVLDILVKKYGEFHPPGLSRLW